MCPTLDAVPLPLSLYEEGFHEALRHKWIESQKCGRDVGTAAITDWYRRHWIPYCRQKRLEHLWGRQSWREFDEDDFGLIESLQEQNDLLLDRILDRLHFGMENLGVILWASDWGLPMPRVLDILTGLDINCARLDPVEILYGG